MRLIFLSNDKIFHRMCEINQRPGKQNRDVGHSVGSQNVIVKCSWPKEHTKPDSKNEAFLTM